MRRARGTPVLREGGITANSADTRPAPGRSIPVQRGQQRPETPCDRRQDEVKRVQTMVETIYTHVDGRQLVPSTEVEREEESALSSGRWSVGLRVDVAATKREKTRWRLCRR